MSTPFLPNLFPPMPQHGQYPPHPPHPAPWSPQYGPPFSPTHFSHSSPGPSSLPPHFLPPPYTSHWRPPMSCDPGHPMRFRSWRGAKRGRGRSRDDSKKRGGVMIECKSCNKEYRTMENYNIHVQSHVKCGRCDFEGTGKALRDHELIHTLPDVLKFSSAEDIQKWREERRKNYPTAENVARKKQLATEKKDRGESAITPLHRYIQRLIGEDGPRASRGGRRGRGFRGGRGRPFNQRGRHRGWSSSKPAREMSSSQEIKEEGEDLIPQTQEENIISAIFADCDELSEGKGETSSPAVVETGEDSDGKFPGSRKRRFVSGKKWNSRKHNKRVKATTGLKAVSGGRKPTLLEKLLAPEIRREENALLQCIRHITSNNYFLTSPSKSCDLPASETSQSCDTSTPSHDNPEPCLSPVPSSQQFFKHDNPEPCLSPVPSSQQFFKHSCMNLELTPQSPDKPISSSEPPDRSYDPHM